jgi:tetratricopeptide (TPR) repeat protein
MCVHLIRFFVTNYGQDFRPGLLLNMDICEREKAILRRERNLRKQDRPPSTRTVFETSNAPTGVRRIVLLGDSVVELVNYVSDEQIIARQLEQQFSDGSTEVVNCGVAGYCTLAEVELLTNKGLMFDPDLVVLLFVENDFWGFNLEHTLDGGMVDRPLIVESLFEGSHLFRQTALSLNLFHFRDELVPSEWHRRAIGENNVVEGFQQLQALSVEHDFEVLIAIWPSFTEDGIEDRQFLPGDDDLVVEQLAWAHGFPTVRLSLAFRRDWDSHVDKPRPDWYYSNGDGMHPSPIGSRVAAAALHQILTATDRPSVGVHQEEVDDNFAAMVAQSLSISEEADSMESRIGWVLRRQNRWVEAEHYSQHLQADSHADFANVFRDKPDLLDEYHRTGLEFLDAGQLYAALDVFQRALAVDPDHVSSHYHRGLTRVRLERWQTARDSFARVLQLEPRHADAQTNWELMEQQLKKQETDRK